MNYWPWGIQEWCKDVYTIVNTKVNTNCFSSLNELRLVYPWRFTNHTYLKPSWTTFQEIAIVTEGRTRGLPKYLIKIQYSMNTIKILDKIIQRSQWRFDWYFEESPVELAYLSRSVRDEEWWDHVQIQQDKIIKINTILLWYLNENEITIHRVEALRFLRARTTPRPMKVSLDDFGPTFERECVVSPLLSAAWSLVRFSEPSGGWLCQ